VTSSTKSRIPEHSTAKFGKVHRKVGVCIWQTGTTIEKEVLGRTNHLHSYDTTRTAEKTKKLQRTQRDIQTARCLATIEWTHRPQGVLMSHKPKPPYSLIEIYRRFVGT
jgi:hypothetical protein